MHYYQCYSIINHSCQARNFYCKNVNSQGTTHAKVLKVCTKKSANAGNARQTAPMPMPKTAPTPPRLTPSNHANFSPCLLCRSNTNEFKKIPWHDQRTMSRKFPYAPENAYHIFIHIIRGNVIFRVAHDAVLCGILQPL